MWSSLEKRYSQYYLTAGALLILVIIILHTYQFQDYNYRQDEAFAMYFVIENTPLEMLQRRLSELHPPGWILIIKIWVEIFGHHEFTSRFFSSIMTSIALALTIRLGEDLCNKRVGWLAALILGTLPFIQFFSHEIRPYSLLIALTCAFSLLYLRWQKYRTPPYSIALIIIGIAVTYTHYYGVFVVLAHALTSLILLRKDWKRLVHLTIIMAIIGGSILIWLIIVFIANGFSQTGDYLMPTNWATVKILYQQMMVHPNSIGIILFFVAILSPLQTKSDTIVYFRFKAQWQKVYVISMIIAILGMVFSSNLFVQTISPRNLIIVLPFFALLLAIGLASFQFYQAIIITIIIGFASISGYEPLISNAAYREVGEYIEEYYRPQESGIIISAPALWEQISIDYYLSERTQLDIDHTLLFNITLQEAFAHAPVTFEHHITDSSQESVDAFLSYIEGKQDIWWVSTREFSDANNILNLLRQDFTLVRMHVFSEGYNRSTTVEHYRRIPETQEDSLIFGNVFHLLSWQLRNDIQVTPCQIVTIDSFWKLDNLPHSNFTMTLVLANQNGNGVTQSDAPPAGILTLLWAENQIYVDERNLTIPCDVASGDYNLLVGIYDENVNLLDITTSNTNISIGEMAYLTTLSVDIP